VVTGRPRAEAEWFLERTDVRGLFESVVCLEDGPNKPDPTPVRIAVEQLAVSKAWMIGDTPDDIRAAVAAGVLPLAVLAPGADPKAHKAALIEAGAVAVLENVESLLELVP
jgi:phosphoglycolate phosphatase-like HAD superfamily hydrolase